MSRISSGILCFAICWVIAITQFVLFYDQPQNMLRLTCFIICTVLAIVNTIFMIFSVKNG